jgi:LysR family transcriptional regulator, cyn operon transcriptional activator
VTYQLRQLEEQLGAPLFVRDRAGMIPTAVADGLYALLGRFATDLDGLRRGGDDTTRPLVVAATSAFGRHVVAPILRGPLFAEHRVHLRFPVADEVVARAAAGELDVGFVFRTVAHAALVAEPVFEATYVLVANASWAARLRSPADFTDVPVVTYDESEYLIGRWIGHHFGRRTPPWHATDHFEELEEVLAAVADGRGVAVVPDVCLPRRPARLRHVRWGKPPLHNTVYAIRRARAPVRPATAQLLHEIRIRGAAATS